MILPVMNTVILCLILGWTENEDDDAGFREHYKAAEEYLQKYLPSSESKFTQTEFREQKSMEKGPRQKDGKVYRDCLDVSPEEVLRNLNKLNLCNQIITEN